MEDFLLVVYDPYYGPQEMRIFDEIHEVDVWVKGRKLEPSRIRVFRVSGEAVPYAYEDSDDFSLRLKW